MGFFDDLLGGLPVIGDVFKHRQQRDEIANSRRRIDANRQRLRYDYLEPLFAQARMFAQQSQDAQRAGFDNARTAIGQLGQASRQRIMDSRDQGLANASQSLQQRGLYNTTLLDAANMGVSAQAYRAMAQLDEGLIGLQANLEQRAGMAEAASIQNFQSLALQELNAQTGIEDVILGSVAGINPVSPGIDFAELAQLVSGFGGLGGGAGAGASGAGAGALGGIFGGI